MRTVVSEPADLISRVGEHLGWSGWHTITQTEIDHFAEATGNRAPVHTDPDFAKSTPFGATIAFGIQVLAMATMLLDDVWELRVSNGVDYGSDKVRHLGPVRSGDAVRLGAIVASAEELPDSSAGRGVRVTLALTFETEGTERPVCAAEIIYVFWF
jgi:acyl dehydratase